MRESDHCDKAGSDPAPCTVSELDIGDVSCGLAGCTDCARIAVRVVPPVFGRLPRLGRSHASKDAEIMAHRDEILVPCRQIGPAVAGPGPSCQPRCAPAGSSRQARQRPGAPPDRTQMDIQMDIAAPSGRRARRPVLVRIPASCSARARLARLARVQRPGGGCRSSNRFPSGSTAQPSRPYGVSPVLSITSTRVPAFSGDCGRGTCTPGRPSTRTG
jgi:hypothetical protein